MSDWENAMENYNEIQEYSLRMAKIKRLTMQVLVSVSNNRHAPSLLVEV